MAWCSPLASKKRERDHLFYLYLADYECGICSILEKKHRMKDCDDGNEYRGGKRGENDDATVLRKLYPPKEPYGEGDEDDI